MLNLAFTALGGWATWRLWNLSRGLAIATGICSFLHYASGRYMTSEAGGDADVYFNILLTIYIIVAFSLSFVI